MGELGAGLPGLDLVGVDDAFFNLREHGDGFLHFLAVADCYRQRIVNHHERRGSHEHLRTRHSDDRRSRSSDAVDLDRDVTLVVHEHGVDLTCRHAVAAGRVDPDDDVALAAGQLLFERLGRDVIVKPALLGNGAVEVERSDAGLFVLCPVPEFLHSVEASVSV